MVDELKTFKLRCASCSSILTRIVMIPETKHIDIYCGVCDKFIGHLWYTELLGNNSVDIHEEIVNI